VSTAKRLGVVDFSEDFRRLLRYGRAVDVTRLTEEVGYVPRYSTVEAVRDWAAKQGGRRLTQPLRRVVAPT
jgi:UDP-glucose 4-epimerase